MATDSQGGSLDSPPIVNLGPMDGSLSPGESTDWFGTWPSLVEFWVAGTRVAWVYLTADPGTVELRYENEQYSISYQDLNSAAA